MCYMITVVQKWAGKRSKHAVSRWNADSAHSVLGVRERYGILADLLYLQLMGREEGDRELRSSELF